MRSSIPSRFHPLSELELERYLCGELSPEQAQVVERLAAEREDLRAHLERRRAEQRAFVLQRPPLRLPRPDRRRFVAWGLGLAAATLTFLVVRPVPPSSITPRGRPKVTVVVRRGERVFEHQAGMLLRAGDALRFTVESGTGGFLTVLGEDRSGSATLYYDGVEATAGSFTAPGSLVLDADPGPEVFYLVLRAARVDAGAIRSALESGVVPDDVTVLSLAKESAQ